MTEAEISETRGKSKVNKFENEVAFARSYLVRGGYIDNSVTGIWTLTEQGKTVDMTEELASEIFKNGWHDMLEKRKAQEKHIWLFARRVSLAPIRG